VIDALLFQSTSFTVLLYGLRVWVAENVAFGKSPSCDVQQNIPSLLEVARDE
jgi:hypothetical protein